MTRDEEMDLWMRHRRPSKIQNTLMRIYRHVQKGSLSAESYDQLKHNPLYYFRDTRRKRDRWFIKLMSLFGPSLLAAPSMHENQAALKKLSAYAHQIRQGSEGTPSPEFVPLSENVVEPADGCPKLISFYLPQFHPFPENDIWWGRGFTEWSNVTKSVPLFLGHHQPQLPIDVGFYDLRLPDVFRRQIELAKLYGISAFCFHYYWFSGRRLLEIPIFNYLKHPEYDLPFCLCWANEPWSRRWDGSENKILMPQNLSDDDDERFLIDILPFFNDERYIRIDSKPLLIIYRPNFWDQKRFLRLVEILRTMALRNNLPGLYLVGAMTFQFAPQRPIEWGLDALVEFPPLIHKNNIPIEKDVEMIEVGDKDFRGRIYDASWFSESYLRNAATEGTRFKTVFPAWDNTARRGPRSDIFISSPAIYKAWLSRVLSHTAAQNSASEQYVFINAWNEWAEGAHLEPDRRYGYAYLQATREALAEFK